MSRHFEPKTEWKLHVCPICGDAKLRGPKHFRDSRGTCEKGGHWAARKIIKVVEKNVS